MYKIKLINSQDVERKTKISNVIILKGIFEQERKDNKIKKRFPDSTAKENYNRK